MKTLRPLKKTYTEKLDECTTWEEVVDLGRPSEHLKPQYVGDNDWILDQNQTSPEDSWIASLDGEEEADYSSWDQLKDILTDNQYKILWMHIEQEMSFRAISVELGVSHQACYKAYKRALRNARNLLGDFR